MIPLRNIALTIFLVTLTLGKVFAKPSADALARANRSFQEANAAYEKTDFKKAADLYRTAIDEGVADSRLYFNYANAMFRENQLGMAILYYEKAKKLAPDDQDIDANLRFINAQIVDKNPAPENNFLTKLIWAMHNTFSINQGLWICLALFTGIFMTAVLCLYAGAGLRAALYTLMVFAGLALCGIAPSLAYKINQQESLQYGIVLKQAVEMFSGPGENFPVLIQVHEGTKFEIVETRGDWVSVKLLNGKGGFVRLSDLGKV